MDDKAYMAAILIEGVGGFSKSFSRALYAMAPVCSTAWNEQLSTILGYRLEIDDGTNQAECDA